MYFIGMPIREKIDKIQMPFDPTLGKREQIKKKAKGFDPNKSESKPSEKEIKDTLELKDEDSLEALLPDFLNTVEQPTLTENYDDESGVTLADLLRLTQRY